MALAIWAGFALRFVTKKIELEKNMSSDRSVSPWIHSVAALTAAVVSTTLTHPLDLIKARLQTQHVMQSVAREVGDSKSTRIAPPRYRSTIQAARLIVREESWRGLYRGLGPNVLGNGLAWGAYMFLYPTFKTWLAGRDGAVNSVESFVLAGLAGAGTQVVTNPIWLVKLRLQSQPHDSDRRYRGMIDAVRTIVREEGILGFWRGLTPALVGTIHGAVQMVIYEAMRAATIRRVEGKDDGGQMGPQHYLLLGTLISLLTP